jgi:hypothetical protein
MAQPRAKQGGEIGANGDWYEGGKFIATTDHAKNRKRKKISTGRQEVAPGVWEIPPTPGAVSIYRRARGAVAFDDKTGLFVPNRTENLEAVKAYCPGAFIAADLYNAGQRWSLPVINS